MPMNDLSVLILTFNEAMHIERCITSLHGITKNIYIVDSYSTDNTVEIATALGAKVFQNSWVNYAKQYQWGLDHCGIETTWVMRMDADEYILPELASEINAKLPTIDKSIGGIYIKRRVNFFNRWIKHGGYYPTWLLRIWRHADGKIEERWMDEHIKLSQGTTINFEEDLVDHNLNNLTWWTQKHNNYATREAVDLLNILYNFTQYDEVEPKLLGTQEQRKRWLKIKYASLPLFLRPFVYFHLRYVLQRGFLDGKAGLVWHFLQGFWYRFLVDAKVYEIYFHAGKEKQSIEAYLKTTYGIDFHA